MKNPRTERTETLSSVTESRVEFTNKLRRLVVCSSVRGTLTAGRVRCVTERHRPDRRWIVQERVWTVLSREDAPDTSRSTGRPLIDLVTHYRHRCDPLSWYVSSFLGTRTTTSYESFLFRVVYCWGCVTELVFSLRPNTIVTSQYPSVHRCMSGCVRSVVVVLPPRHQSGWHVYFLPLEYPPLKELQSLNRLLLQSLCVENV